jgi:hypothetical protein
VIFSTSRQKTHPLTPCISLFSLKKSAILQFIYFAIFLYVLWARGAAQMVEYQLSKPEALSSIHSTVKKKKKDRLVE